MTEDKTRWNKKYATYSMPGETASILTMHLHVANVGRALDIACGMGRNSMYLAEHGFVVDAVDISDQALSQIPMSDRIHTIEADLDEYEIAKESYDLIINCNYLDRAMFSAIKNGLKDEGVVIFETFVEADATDFHQPSDPDFLLQSEELKNAFLDLDIIKYEEVVSQNLRGEKVNIASLVARKRSSRAKGEQ